MVVVEVVDIQQVTTRSKGKTTEWKTQEAIRKQATEWVKKANERKVAELEQQKEKPDELTDNIQPENLAWQALQELPRFTEGLKSRMTAVDTPPAPTFFSNLEEGPTVVDTISPMTTEIVKGQELPRTIVDGGSGVNEHHYLQNIITFRRGKAKVRVPIELRSSTGKEQTPLYRNV